MNETSQSPLEGGINKWSGLVELAEEGKYVVKPAQGWYQRFDNATGEFIGDKMRMADIENNSAFWKKLFEETDFADWLKNKYTTVSGSLINDEDDEDGV